MICGEKNVQVLRLLHEQIECSMQNLRFYVDISTYEFLLVPLVTEKLPNHSRVLIARKYKN